MKKSITKKEVKQTINKIYDLISKDKHSDIIFGGSFALKLHGLLDREIHDIDLVLPYHVYNELTYNLNKNDINKKMDSENQHQSINDVPNDVEKKDSLNINGVNVCVFVSSNQFITNKKIMFDIELKLLTPFQILSYKHYYLNKNQQLSCDSNLKHKNDIINVSNKINEHLNNILI